MSFDNVKGASSYVMNIKDNEGNIVAQSWVWRNGNTLCFDNIEVYYEGQIR